MIRRENAIVSGLFLAAVFCASFDKVHWAPPAPSTSPTSCRSCSSLAWAIDRFATPVRRVTRTVAVLIVFFFAFLLVYLIGFFNLDTQDAANQFGKGIVKWPIHFVFLIVAVAYIAGTLAPLLLAHAHVVLRRDHVQCALRAAPARRRAGGPQPRLASSSSR